MKHFWGNLFKRKQTHVSLDQQHPQLNGTKSVELEIVYARVHLLNEGGLYKMDQTKTDVLTSCSFITSRAHTDAVAYINAMGHQ